MSETLHFTLDFYSYACKGGMGNFIAPQPSYGEGETVHLGATDFQYMCPTFVIKLHDICTLSDPCCLCDSIKEEMVGHKN